MHTSKIIKVNIPIKASLFPNDTIPVNNETTPKAVKQTNSAMM